MTKTMTKVWTIYKFVSKLTWIGIIEAKTEKEAIEKAAEVPDLGSGCAAS
jgi:hypothetical protein